MNKNNYFMTLMLYIYNYIAKQRKKEREKRWENREMVITNFPNYALPINK